MNTYHPQIKKELGFPAACSEKGIGKRNNSKKAKLNAKRYNRVTDAPKNALNRDLNYEKMSSAAAKFLLNI